jgi:hypothetical protein
MDPSPLYGIECQTGVVCNPVNEWGEVENEAYSGWGRSCDMRAALGVEAAIVIVGLWLFVSGTALTRGRSLALVGLTLLTLVFTAAGMTLAPAPPSGAAMASGSLATLALVCAAAYWCGRRASRV